MQAQEYPFAKWALALRLAGAADADDVERAFADGRILRTHVLRPTWHFVAAEDIVWMLELTAPRVLVAMRTYMKHQGLDMPMMTRAIALVERALAGGRALTRLELGDFLARGGMAVNRMQLMMIAMYGELERVICSGPRRGKDFTYALLAERAPQAPRRPADESLAVLTERFFGSHGPATLRDFVWWSGLRVGDARRGLEIAGLRGREVDGLTYWGGAGPARRTPSAAGVHLLPIYDEYLVAYRDRVAVPHGPRTIGSGKRAVNFRHALVIDGQVAGTWTVAAGAAGQQLRVTPLRALTRAERTQLAAVARRYERYLGTPLPLAVAPGAIRYSGRHDP